MARTAYVQKCRMIVNGYTIPDVVFVSGLGLGEEGTVEASEPSRKLEVSDGVRKVDPLTIRFQKKKNLVTFKYFLAWWNNRAADFRDCSFSLWDKLFSQELHRYFASECEIKSWKEGDQEQASPKIGEVELMLLPYDMEMIEVA